ncbi:MAG: YheU family protein [Deltaproteobacteria bacterium]|nr:YheU family protein [Deltaproteobacteria bacterium]
MEIPWDQLQPETLRALVEEFVLREGTEYGERDVPLADKVDAVLRQLRRGEARVLYDPDSETTTIASR